jgi:hypothetical protein
MWLIMILGGANYLLRSEYMPYHAMRTHTPGGPPLFLGLGAIALVFGAAALSFVGRPR